MHAVPALPEWQRQFLDALYDADAPGPRAVILGNGLEPDARLRIYRHSSEAIHTGALRITYPAVLALVGEDYFDQAVRGYRGAHPSPSGNLQAFGTRFAEYLETLPDMDALAYLPDVARLEWLRQESALAADAEPTAPDTFTNGLAHAGESLRIGLHPSVRLWASVHPILTIWRYAIQPTSERLVLDGEGEYVVLWREDSEVAMAGVDPASFTCIASLASGDTLDAAHAAAQARDPAFDLAACLASLCRQNLISAIDPFDESCEEPAPCR
ncbi:putative DNA-binding domain-containing protein [Rhodanobacter sp. Si-c]|uniref:DNA-binding domain-containing protein n=1 Tax=Rhodanobacter lycopersici TaxID=3162487 RepID=A0ABV3QEM4_9GAMM